MLLPTFVIAFHCECCSGISHYQVSTPYIYGYLNLDLWWPRLDSSFVGIRDYQHLIYCTLVFHLHRSMFVESTSTFTPNSISWFIDFYLTDNTINCLWMWSHSHWENSDVNGRDEFTIEQENGQFSSLIFNILQLVACTWEKEDQNLRQSARRSDSRV
jgi:hypothetical protein